MINNCNFKIRISSMLLFIVFCFYGCTVNNFELSSLMRPPRPPGDIGEIQLEIERIHKKEVQFKYPKSGDLKSAIVLHDVDTNGLNEAFAFYRVNTSDAYICLLILQKTHNSWVQIREFILYGDNVDRILFGDVDGDGRDELIVGWSSNNSTENKINVYDYKEDNFQEINLNATYNELLVTDIDDDGIQELFTIQRSDNGEKNFVHILKFDIKSSCYKFQVISTTNMVADMNNIHLIAGNIDKNRKGVFIEGTDVYRNYLVTDLVYWDKQENNIINPLSRSGYLYPLVPRVFSVYSKDADNDGIIEIPKINFVNTNRRAKDLAVPCKLDWIKYNLDNNQFIKGKSLICNYLEKYSLVCPSKWCDSDLLKIFVNIDDENRTMTFSENVVDVNGFNASGVDLFTIGVFSENEWNQYSRSMTRIYSEDKNIYAITQINLEHSLSISKEDIINSFEKIKSA